MKEERQPLLLLEVQKQVHDVEPDGHVEHRGGLVGQDELGLHRQGPRDAHALPLAAREFVRVFVDVAFRGFEAATLEQRLRLLPHVFPGGETVDEQRALQDVRNRVDGVERRKGVLKNHLDPLAVAPQRPPAQARGDRFTRERHLARGGLVKSGDEPRDGGLARARFTNEPQHLAFADGEVDVAHRRNFGRAEHAAQNKSFAEAVSLEHGRLALFSHVTHAGNAPSSPGCTSASSRSWAERSASS